MMLSVDERQSLMKGLHEYIDKNCIFRCNPQEVYQDGSPPGVLFSNYPSKDNMTWMFMLRRLMHQPNMLTAISAIFLDDLIKRHEDGRLQSFQLTGLETSSIPLMIGLQQYAGRYRLGINSFSIRRDRKPYGLFNYIDGEPSDAPVIVIDDTINSGLTLASCYDMCKHELDLVPAPVSYSIVKFNENMETVKWYDHTIEVVSLFSVNDFSLDYDPEKYWLPKDCDKSYNKRPEYN